MKNFKKNLQIEQLDKKIKVFNHLEKAQLNDGWIKIVRTTLGMSLEQLGNKMNVSAQAVRGFEQREKNGTISLNNLNEAAKALGLKLVYGLSAPDKSLKKMIEIKALALAEEIIARTDKTMKLEDQANSRSRLKKAIKARAEEIVDKNIKYLWK
jgi:predicted DNA-binding mobile mystery protein A